MKPVDSVWIRDYGAWHIHDGTASAGIVDLVYNRPRPNDDKIPREIANAYGYPVYHPPLVHAGGNFMADGWGTAVCSDLILEENPGLTEAALAILMSDYFGCDCVLVLPRIHYEYTGHIDLYLKLLAPDLLLVGEWPRSDPNWGLAEAVVARFRDMASPFGRPYRFCRVPMPEPSADTLHSYANSLIIGGKVLVPTGNFPEDSVALEAYREALPGYDVQGRNCTAMGGSGGAIHCVTKNFASITLLRVLHVPLADTALPAGP
ncbi:MAG: agmatine deiminase family protein [Planctomycetota bacterium]